MPKKQYDIDIESFIRSTSLETFTVTDVTRHLLQIHATLFDKKKNATQFVYRHLKALERQGVIKTLTTNNQKAIVFGWSGHRKTTNKAQKHKIVES